MLLGELESCCQRDADEWFVAEAKARPELGSVSDAIVSWDTAGDQTQPCDVALGPLLDYA